MTGLDRWRIAEMWLRGMNTQQIAVSLDVPECVIYGSELEAALRDHCDLGPRGYPIRLKHDGLPNRRYPR